MNPIAIMTACISVLITLYWFTRSFWKTCVLFFLFGAGVAYSVASYDPEFALDSLTEVLCAATGIKLLLIPVNDELWPVYETGPVDGIPVYLQHGYSGDKSLWLEYMSILGKAGFRVFAADALGHGNNSMNSMEGDYTPLNQARQVVELMAVLIGKDNKFHMMGNSYGGHIALEIAIAFPKLLITVSPMDSAGLECPQYTPWQASGAEFPPVTTLEEWDEFVRLMLGSDPNNLPPAWKLTFVKRATMIKRNRKSKLMTYIFWQLVEDAKSRPLNDKVASISIPMLVAWGSEDKIIHVSCGKKLHELVDSSELFILDGRGHLPMAELGFEQLASRHIQFMRQHK